VLLLARRASVLAMIFTLAACWSSPRMATGAGHGVRSAGALETDVKSAFSHIRVRKQGDVRSLIFVRDSGEEVVETLVNIRKPHEMLAPYTRAMFTSYLLRPKQEDVLIVGLGGGAMVHFLKHYDPDLHVDAVEIDPAVVKIADQYFDVRSGGNVKIVTADGFQFLEKTEKRYDVVYMDAFLKPAEDTDSAGQPLRLKTIRFYKSIQAKVKPQGLVAFNLNPTESTDADIKTIRAAFPQVYVYRVLDTNVIVIGSLAEQRETVASLKAKAKDADHRFKASFSFQDPLGWLVR
jgi:spermidine synthase